MSHQNNPPNPRPKGVLQSLCGLCDPSRAAKITGVLQSLFLLGIRLVWGYGFAQAGWGKFKNLGRVTEFFDGLGIPLAHIQAPFVAGVEFLGGILIILGLGSRVVAIPLAGTMMVAYLTAHRDELFGIFKDSEAFFAASPFLYLFTMLIIILFGPGRFSLDRIIFSRLHPSDKSGGKAD